MHRLVAQIYVPNLENKSCVNHKDGNKLNNSYSNLEWCTYKENIKHSFQTGLHNKIACGKDISTKLTEEDVEEIRHLYSSAYELTQKDLAKQFNVHQSTISYIISNKTWRHLCV